MKPAISTKITFDTTKKLGRSVKDRVSKVVRITALDVEGYAKTVVPVDTGNLKNSIQTMMESDVSAVVGTPVHYAIYVEFGTSRMAARPYLLPALERAKKPFVEAMKKILRT